MPIKDAALRDVTAYASRKSEPKTPTTTPPCSSGSPRNCPVGILEPKTRESIPMIKISLIDRSKPLTFNICKTQPPPIMKRSPKFKMLTPAYVAGKNNATSDSLSKRTASFTALPPAEHPAAWEALTLIVAANAAITRPRIVDSTKASPICQKLGQLIQTGLPEQKKDWPEELTSYVPYRRYLTESERVIKCGNRTVIPADSRQEALNILHKGHAEVTTMLTKAN